MGTRLGAYLCQAQQFTFCIPLIDQTICPRHTLKKSNRLLLVTYPTHPSSFVITHPHLFEISCYISLLTLSLNGEASLRYFNALVSGSESGSFTKIESIHLSHTQHVHQVSSESVHNFWRYRTDKQTDR